MKLPNIFMPEKDLEGDIEKLLKEEQVEIQPEYDRFEVVKVNNYAEGIAKLKEQGKKQFTFYENVEARIADYWFNGENAELFKTWLDSVTGIAHKARSTKFKLILRSDKLENIIYQLDQIFIPINYETEQGIEFDSKEGKYNQTLTREEAKNHKFWLAAMNGNKEKLAEYVDLWFDKTGRKEGLGVYLRSNMDEDQLRALGLCKGSDYVSGCGDSMLFDDTCFVLGVQQK